MNILKNIIRIGIGLFFIVSAVLKLFSLDQFELYIYSFNLFSFTMSALAARIIIACEILVGILLIIKVKYKFAWWLTMLMLIGFSFLLIYVILFRNDTNCHCMGDLVEIKPSISLIKNIIGIVLMLFIRKEEDYVFRWKNLALALAFVAAIVPPFVLLPMDNVYNFFSKSDSETYNETAFNGLMADSVMQDVNLDNGNYIVGIILSGCQFCHTSALKMSEMVDNNNIDSSRILYFACGDSLSLRQFQTETKTESFRFIRIDPVTAIHITNGAFPTYLFLKDGYIEKAANLRQLTEKSLCDHLQ
jgi:uncharacterized membrane protein YphA (DoxX/SURF4 family)